MTQTQATLGKSDCHVEFDHHGADLAADPIAAYTRLRNNCPISWSEASGGFWVVTGYDDCFAVLQDDYLFSSARERGGVNIPAVPPYMTAPPVDLDPPQHGPYKKLLTPGTSPRAVEKLRDDVVRWTDEAVDSIIESGQGDLLKDVGGPVPTRAIMTMLDYDLAQADRYSKVWHESFVHRNDDQKERVLRELLSVSEEGRALFWQRRRCPTNDVVGYVAARSAAKETSEMTVLADSELENVGNCLLGGGIDTTSNLFASTVIWLAQHPDQRRWLIDDETIWDTAQEEFLRFFSPVTGLGRTVMKDVVWRGHRLEEGDRLWLSFGGANHDPAQFPRASELLLNRTPNRHIAFGVGRHRCVGSSLARLIFPIMLKAVLTRLPDWELVADEIEVYTNRSTVNGFANVPVTFTPGSRLS